MEHQEVARFGANHSIRKSPVMFYCTCGSETECWALKKFLDAREIELLFARTVEIPDGALLRRQQQEYVFALLERTKL